MTAAMIILPNPPRPIPPPGGGVPRPPFPLWPTGWYKSSDDFDCYRACYLTVKDLRSALGSKSGSAKEVLSTAIYCYLLSNCEKRLLEYINVPADFCWDLMREARADLEFQNNIMRSLETTNKELLYKTIGRFCGRICRTHNLA
ncbi:hypothetical protein OESDEN_13124 [Oesophagostomum dentatum]|uniref:Uncharacterized protein n=1 Tax=Oesophagostomum dentatum TaxID=61180 RepID=A0A0B1SP57_OESDE|nr:hypothetical protein OESDEN_13124 [Oesophagostomum dentatum]